MASFVTTLVLLTFIIRRTHSQEFTSSPESVSICDVQSMPMAFTLTCGFTGPVFPVWNVTGLSMGGSATLFRGQSVDGYLTYPQPSLDIARLNVDLTSMQVVNGTCFQCELDMTGGNVVSERGCVTVVVLPCVKDVEVQGTTESMIEITWTPPMSGLKYSIQACPDNGASCKSFSCVNCTTYTAEKLLSGVNYTITVNSVAEVTGGITCESQNCQNNSVFVATNATDSISPPISSTSSTTASSIPAITPTPTGVVEPPPPPLIGAIVGGIAGGIIVVALVVIIIVVAVIIFKHMKMNKTHGEKLTAHRGEEMIDVHGDMATYAAPDKEKPAAEGGEGVYSYAATTTVVGAKHSKPEVKPGSEQNITGNVSVQPEKPMRGSKKQPPSADVSHKQGPVGDLYAMPDKKVPEVGHKPGPQGDMYAVAAKPSKGGYGAEGPN